MEDETIFPTKIFSQLSCVKIDIITTVDDSLSIDKGETIFCPKVFSYDEDDCSRY